MSHPDNDDQDDEVQARADVARYDARAGWLLAATLLTAPALALTTAGLATLSRPAAEIAVALAATGVDAATVVLCVLALLPRERGTRRPADPRRTAALKARLLTAAFGAVIVTAVLVVATAIAAATT